MRRSTGERLKNQFKPLAPPIITKPADLGHQYPAHIYNAMIAPVRPMRSGGMSGTKGNAMPRTLLKRSIILISSGK